MKSHAPHPNRWNPRDRLIIAIFCIVSNAIVVAMYLADLPKVPGKWVIGSLTIFSAPIIFVAIVEFASGWLEKVCSNGWREFLAQSSVVALFVGLDFAIFILLSWLWQGLKALDYGAIWTTGSVVLSDIAAIIAIYQVLRRRKKRRHREEVPRE